MQSILNFIRIRLVVASTLLIFMAILYYFWPQGTPPEGPPFIVEVEYVEKGPLVKTVKLLARVSSKQETTFISHVKSRIKAIYVEEGKAVTKGMMLAELDNAELLREAESVRTRVKLAKDQYDRLLHLQKSNTQSKANLDKAHENLLQANISLDQVEDRLAKTQFFAPFDGVCGVFRIRPGQTIKEGDVIVSCYDTSGFSLNIDVPETLIASLQAGQAIRYKESKGLLQSVQKSIDPVTGMGLARADVDGTWEVSSGQLISIDVDVESKTDVISLPRGAIFMKDGGNFVYTIVDGKANLQAIETGLQSKTRIEITQGLQSGDKVVLKGQENIWPTRPLKELDPETEIKAKE